MTQKSYYAQLKPIAEKYLKTFKTDFLVYDKKILKGNTTGSFIFALRETGTNLYNYGELSEMSEEETKDHKNSSILWMTKTNTLFYNCQEGKIKKIELSEAVRIIDQNPTGFLYA